MLPLPYILYRFVVFFGVAKAVAPNSLVIFSLAALMSTAIISLAPAHLHPIMVAKPNTTYSPDGTFWSRLHLKQIQITMKNSCFFGNYFTFYLLISVKSLQSCYKTMTERWTSTITLKWIIKKSILEKMQPH